MDIYDLRVLEIIIQIIQTVALIVIFVKINKKW